ncbi:MAG TPA: PspA/IM30 family protein [Oscillatoriales cyanobacterium M59_W2019_021]|nr:MAG: PspA/IM30 family protein [Cyanobacteria bacterium J055]HIK31078.1 PspA/IM30 family protein [Oscillatoriales cyanobacterium M4454_W2019_049]HIK51148.1 PspA/IM30 family protein [Oscillatoriales cyanobacterium M59_W2019_021]
MKRAIYWLMGEKAGRAIVGTWNWLWGLPVESGGKIAVAVAEESLRSMQESVQKLTQAVSTQVAAYQRAQQKYQTKVRDLQHFQQQAIVAQQQGNDSAARLAMTKVIQIEQLLPQLESRVQQAEQFVNASRERLERERMKLEAYKMEMENLKDMAEINEALATLAQVNSELGIDSAKTQFEEAKNAIERRNLQEQAYAELAENPAEKLEADLDRMTLDQEVSRRLRQLSEPNN